MIDPQSMDGVEPGAWVGRVVVGAFAVLALVLAVGAAAIAWHPVAHDPWSPESVSADGRTLFLRVQACGPAKAIDVDVHEDARSVAITITSALPRFIGGSCGGIELDGVRVHLRQSLGTRGLR